MKVLYIVNIPSPYRVSFFNELGKSCELTVLFERKSSSSANSSWHDYSFNNFKAIFLKGIKYRTSHSINVEVVKYLSNNTFDSIVIGGYATPSSVLAISYLKLKNIPFVLNVDGGLINKSESNIKKNIKKGLISSADAWLSTGNVSTSYLKYYGADEKLIFKYPFTTLSEKDLLKNKLEYQEKKLLKDKLNIPEKRVILSVGQFIHRKGFDILMQACSDLSDEIGIYIVGGMPTEEYLKKKQELGLKNVHFIGFKTKEELTGFYMASDLFVLPTREDIWGLVINEALSYGLPVITTDKCVAGIELVEDKVNGFIVPVEDATLLGQRIKYCLENDGILESMSNHSLKKIKPYTIENMAKVTKEILINITEKAKR